MAEKKPHIIEHTAEEIMAQSPTVEHPDLPTRKKVLQDVVKATGAELQRISSEVHSLGTVTTPEEIAREAELNHVMATTSTLRIYNASGADTAEMLMAAVAGGDYPREVTTAVEELKNALARAKVSENLRDVQIAHKRFIDANRVLSSIGSREVNGVSLHDASGNIDNSLSFFQQQLADLRKFQRKAVEGLPDLPAIPTFLEGLTDPEQVESIDTALTAFLENPVVGTTLEKRELYSTALTNIATADFPTAAEAFKDIMSELGGSADWLRMKMEYSFSSTDTAKSSFREFYLALQAKANVIDDVRALQERLKVVKTRLKTSLATRRSAGEKIVQGLRTIRSEYTENSETEGGLDQDLKTLCERVSAGDQSQGLETFVSMTEDRVTSLLDDAANSLVDSEVTLRNAESHALQVVEDHALEKQMEHEVGFRVKRFATEAEAIKVRREIYTSLDTVAQAVGKAEAAVLEKMRDRRLAELLREAARKMLETLSKDETKVFPNEEELKKDFQVMITGDRVAEGQVVNVYRRFHTEYKNPAGPVPRASKFGLLGHLRRVSTEEITEPALEEISRNQNLSKIFLDAITDCRDAYMGGIISTIESFLLRQVVAPAVAQFKHYKELKKEIDTDLKEGMKVLKDEIDRHREYIQMERGLEESAVARLHALNISPDNVDFSPLKAAKDAETNASGPYMGKKKLLMNTEARRVKAQEALEDYINSDSLDKDETLESSLREAVSTAVEEIGFIISGYLTASDGNSRVALTDPQKHESEAFAADGEIYPGCTPATLGLDALRLYVRAKAEGVTVDRNNELIEAEMNRSKRTIEGLESKIRDARTQLVAKEMEKNTKERDMKLIETKILMLSKVYQELEHVLAAVADGQTMTHARENELAEIHGGSDLKTALLAVRKAEKTGSDEFKNTLLEILKDTGVGIQPIQNFEGAISYLGVKFRNGPNNKKSS